MKQLKYRQCKALVKNKTENKIIKAISDSLLESLSIFDDDIFDDDDEYHVSEKLEPDYVDLGLPSGTLWCKCNVGAKSETDYGNYYQWGETENNVIAHDDNSVYEKYNSKDKLSELLPEDDIAYQTSNGFYRIPTQKQFTELYVHTNNQWVKNFNDTGINGLLVKSRVNDNYIFIPAGGEEYNGKNEYINILGMTWSSTNSSFGFAYRAYFSGSPEFNTASRHRRLLSRHRRLFRLPIRPVVNN